MAQNYFSKNTNSPKFNTKSKSFSFFAISKGKQSKNQSLVTFLSFFMMLFLGSKIDAQTTTVTISTTGAGTWIVPAGVTGSITVEAWGAGGSGGGVSGKSIGASGGTGGTYVSSTFSGVVAGTTYNLFVAPSNPYTGLGISGTNGQGSWFNTSGTLFANGGLGGNGGSSNGSARTAITTGSIGTIITSGSSTSAGTANLGSAGGNGGNSGGIGGAFVTTAGNNSFNDGNSGAAPGGGGSGSTVGGGSGSASWGGAGARGEIRITYTKPPCTAPTTQPTALLLTPTKNTINGSFTLPSPVSDNYLVVVSTSITVPTPVDGITYTIGSTALGGSNVVADTDSNNTFTATGLSSSTLYYIYVFSYNYSSCSAGPKYKIASPLSGNTTTLAATYCTPTYSTGPLTTDQITNVTLGTLNNSSGAAASPYYTFYNAVTIPNLTQSSTASVSVTLGSDANQYVGVWIDFNRDGDFQTSEGVVSSINAGSNGTTILSIPVPAGATLGNTRMRVRGGEDYALTTAQACDASSSSYGETEDYIVNIIVNTPCVAPTASATSLNLTPTNITIPGSFTLASPAADNYLVVLSTSATAPTPANGTTYAVGSTALGGSNIVVDTDNNNTFMATGLSSSTLYYIYVFSYNNSFCSGGPKYKITAPLSGSTTTLATTYCVPTYATGSASGNHITNVALGTLSNSTGASSTPFYTFYNAVTKPDLTATSTASVSVTLGAQTNQYVGVWIDFNQDNIFQSTEGVVSGNAGPGGTIIINIPVPAGAVLGNTRMRVRGGEDVALTTAQACSASSDSNGETEDYIVNIIPIAACIAPTAQPTNLTLTPTNANISGSFTLANPAADNYLIVRSTSTTAPTPVNGVTYTVGSTLLGGSNVVVDTDSNNTFTATGLTPATLYYIYVFSYNNSSCTGGPKYKTNSPLSGNTNTYCIPSVSSGKQSTYYIKDVNFIGNITNSDNTSTYSSSTLGYQDQTSLGTKASQAQGEGVNIYLNTTYPANSNFAKAWVDWNRNGTFDTSELVYQCTYAFKNTTFGFKIPQTTVPGDYRIRIRINKYISSSSTTHNSFTACGNLNNEGETEDYLFTVVADCAAKITTISNGFNCGTNSVTLGAKGSTGTTEYRWYTTQTGGSYVSTTSSTWPTPSISATTTYYVTAFNGSCESVSRIPVVATIKPVPTLTFTNANPNVCGENNVFDLQALGNNEQVYLIDEDFESGLGNFTSNSIVSPIGEDLKTKWQLQTSSYVPPYPTFPVWLPAISSGFGTNKFVMSTSDVALGGQTFGKVENALESATINTTGFLNLSLSFKMYFSSYYDANSNSVEYVNVEVSTNGGSSWVATPIAQYLTDFGIGTQFKPLPIPLNLNAFTGITSLKIRIRYKAGWCDGVAIDDIKLFGDKPLSPSFQWTSVFPIDAYTDAACTLPYTTGTPAPIVYVKPTLAQLEQAAFSFTATANLANGCSTSAPVNVTNTTKIWQGGSATDWSNATNWKPAGVPTADNCVIIPAKTIIPNIPSPGALAKNLTIKPTGNLELLTDSNLTVTDFVKVDNGGVFNIDNNASLVQINNVANMGTATIERITQPMNRYDFTYWSSPLTAASNFTLGTLSPLTLSDKYFSWTPSIGGVSGNWKFESIGTKMTPGIGYIVRAPQNYNISGTKTNYTGNFVGTPNNGDVSVPITYGSMGALETDDKWNLLGNPYPSAISAATFLENANNASLLDGTIYFWTHNSPPEKETEDPFYGDFVINYTEEDYATWNKTGGTATAGALTGGVPPNGFIASGQSFLTISLGVPGNAIFKNDMRRDISTGATYTNSQFFKQTNNNKSNKNTEINTETNTEKHRIWLNLTNNSGAFSQILVGYVPGATQDRDRSYDGESLGGNDVSFYSIIPETTLTIQGRALPFDRYDQVNLGYNAAIAGTFSIRIDHVDGLFSSHKIFLEDKLLQVIHDLKQKPYVFTTEEGDFNDRFVLRYSDKTKETDIQNLTETVMVTVKEKVTVYSSEQPIKNIVVYDLSGRKIDSYKKVNAWQFDLKNLNKTTAGLIVKITLDNDVVVNKKIIY